MKVILLGTGGPRPDPERHASSLVVATEGNHLLFDCGRGAVQQLVRAGVDLGAVNPVFITHHHYDHIADLADVILSTWLQGRRGALRIFGPAGTSAIVSGLLDTVYAKDIRFRAEGEPAIGGWKPVEVTEIRDGRVFDGNSCTVSSELVEHGQGLGIPDFEWVTLGYRIAAEGKALAVSGDAIPCPGLYKLAEGADTLVQCCYLADSEITTPHAERLTRFLFATASQVGEIAASCKVKKLVLTHFRKKKPELLDEIADTVSRFFTGDIVLGRDLLEVDV